MVEASPCSAFKDCGSCSLARAEPGAPACFWCYDAGGACHSLNNPLNSSHPLGGCSKWTLQERDCECRQFETCGECATMQHALVPKLCEWTTTRTTVSIASFIGMQSFDLGKYQSCRSGQRSAPFEGALTGPGVVHRNVSITPTLSFAIDETPTTWFYAQCKVSGPTPMAITLSLAGLVTCLVVCCFACLVRRCSRRKRRRLASDDWGRLYAIDAPMLAGGTLNAHAQNSSLTTSRGEQRQQPLQATPNAPPSQQRTVRWRQ